MIKMIVSSIVRKKYDVLVITNEWKKLMEGIILES